MVEQVGEVLGDQGGFPPQSEENVFVRGLGG